MGKRPLTLFCPAFGWAMRLARGALDPQRRHLWRRLAGAVLAACFISLLVALWHPVYRFTGLLQVGQDAAARALAVVREQPVLVYEGGYDGQYSAQLACDPSLRSPELHTAIDALPYRARRILMPATAWVLGLGRPEWAIQIFPWLNIVCWFALALVLWAMLQADRRWLGVVAWAGVMFSAGALASVRYSLTDLPSLLLFIFALRAVQAGRQGRMAAWFGASILARETMVIGILGLLPGRGASADRLFRTGFAIIAAVVPFGCWLAYVHWSAGTSEASAGVRNFAWPGVGLVGDWIEEIAHATSGNERVLGVKSLVATLGLTLQAVFLLVCWRPQDRWWRVGAGMAALMFVLGPAVWEGYFGAVLRVMLPLQLACTILAIEHRRSAWWLLLLNLSIPAALADAAPQFDSAELAVVRHGDVAAVMRTGAGCYMPESLRKDHWVWTAQEAQCRLRIWSESDAVEVLMSMRVRALDERELVVAWSGGELWRGRVGRDWTLVTLPAVPAKRGELVLTLHSDSPAVRGGSAGDVRLFSVCLLNPQIELR